MQSPKRRQYKYAKSRYRVKNWAAYEAGLRRRGDLTVWLSDEALDAWRAPSSGKPGGQRRYADIAIEAALMIRMILHLPLRQIEGFMYSLMQLLDIDLPIPDHTTLSRRLQTPGEIPFQHPIGTQRPAEVRAVNSHEGEEPERALHPRTGSTKMAQAVRLQPRAAWWRTPSTDTDDPRRRHQESMHKGATSGATARL